MRDASVFLSANAHITNGYLRLQHAFARILMNREALLNAAATLIRCKGNAEFLKGGQRIGVARSPDDGTRLNYV